MNIIYQDIYEEPTNVDICCDWGSICAIIFVSLKLNGKAQV